MHDEREQAERIRLIRRLNEAGKAYAEMRKLNDAAKAYSVSNELGDETESQVECIIMVPKPDPNEPPPLTRHDEECFRYFVWGCIAGPVTLVVMAGMSWLTIKGIDAGFWWMGFWMGAK